MFFLFIVTALSTISVECGIINLCDSIYGEYDGYPIFKGQNIKGAQVLQTVSGMFSKAHCAVTAMKNPDARAAVYTSDGKCRVLRDYYGFSNITFSDSANQDLIVLQNAVQATSGCPTCTNPAICMYDCTTGVPQVGCMESASRTGTCDALPILQFKEYYLKNFDKESWTSGYAFFNVVFRKTFSWTALRVAFRATLRGARNIGAWGRSVYQIQFNDTSCSSPAPIESLHYEADTGDVHKAAGITGLCYWLPAGNATISLKIQVDVNSYTRIGYATYGSRLFVQELGQPGFDMNYKPAYPCPALPAYNIREYFVTNDRGEDCCNTLEVYTYTKLEADTTLKLSWDGILRLLNTATNDVKCAIWFLKVDGNHCNPQPIGRVLANLGGSDTISNQHRSFEIEGYCRGLSVGAHTVELRIDRCIWEFTADGYLGDTYTGGWSLARRFIVEEFREGTTTIGIMGTDGNMYRIPEFNIAIFAWAHVNNPYESGTMLSLTYTKKYSSSGLRLVYNGDHRSYPWQSYCCRLYFVVGGVECSNPGPIEGITYQTKVINFHRPVIFDGVCEGVTAGSLSIQLMAGMCRGFTTTGDCHFGWNSYLNVLASEVYVDREIINF